MQPMVAAMAAILSGSRSPRSAWATAAVEARSVIAAIMIALFMVFYPVIAAWAVALTNNNPQRMRRCGADCAAATGDPARTDSGRNQCIEIDWATSQHNIMI
jgi:hypothetical protein